MGDQFLSVESDIKKATRFLVGFEKEIDKQASRALNKAASKVRTKATRQIAKETGIKPQKKIRDRILIAKANRNRLVSSVIAKALAENLIEFVVPSKRNTTAFRKQIGVQHKAYKRKQFADGAFIGSGKNSGKMMVFKRQGPGRDSKLKSVYGPNIKSSFIEKRVNKLLRTVGQEAFVVEFNRLLDLSVRKLKG